MDRVTLKLKYQGVVRRVALPRPIGIEEVREVVQSLYGMQDNDYVLSYIDEEGDKIVVNSSVELEEAVALAGTPLIRLDLEKKEHDQKEKEEDQPVDTADVEVSADEKKRLEESEKERTFVIPLGNLGDLTVKVESVTTSCSRGGMMRCQVAAKKPEDYVHWAICDVCQQRIKHIRYKCSVCEDYDLCAKCEEDAEEHHPKSHAFLKLTPSSARCMRRNQSRCPWGGRRRNNQGGAGSCRRGLARQGESGSNTDHHHNREHSEITRPRWGHGRRGAPLPCSENKEERGYVKKDAEEPVAEEPVAEEPVVEEPVVEEPVVEEPVAEEPVAEEPVAEEPVAEEPVAEEPVEEVSEERARALEALLPLGFDVEVVNSLLDVVNNDVQAALEALLGQ